MHHDMQRFDFLGCFAIQNNIGMGDVPTLVLANAQFIWSPGQAAEAELAIGRSYTAFQSLLLGAPCPWFIIHEVIGFDEHFDKRSFHGFVLKCLHGAGDFAKVFLRNNNDRFVPAPASFIAFFSGGGTYSRLERVAQSMRK